MGSQKTKVQAKKILSTSHLTDLAPNPLSELRNNELKFTALKLVPFTMIKAITQNDDSISAFENLCHAAFKLIKGAKSLTESEQGDLLLVKDYLKHVSFNEITEA